MPDRLAALLASTTLNGIDFVEVTSAAQTSLRVHFLNSVPVAGTLAPTTPVTITGGESVPSVPVEPPAAGDWGFDDAGRPTLELRTPFPGDFSGYRLHIDSSVLDSYYASAAFSFKAGCPSDLDCAPVERCDEPPGGGPVIDYLAKDYASLRAALLDYSAGAYPHWVERDEPDLGMMLLELLSAAGDDLSYLQDRIAHERSLATATQRVSVVRHARLVDYEPRPATSARALVQVDVTATALPAGVTVRAPQPDGGTLSFELGNGLVDPDTGTLTGGPAGVDPRWNRLDHTANPPVPRIVPYWWDNSRSCLPAGACEMWVRGHGFGFVAGDPQRGTTGTALLLDTAAASPADPPTRAVVHLTGAEEETDLLYGVPLTHLRWDATEALAAEHALERTVLAGNLVPAVEGRRHVETFVIDPDPGSPDAGRAAVTRGGPDAGCGGPAPTYLHTLAQGRLAWLGSEESPGAGGRPAGHPRPELCLTQLPADPGDLPRTWRWRRSLLDAGLFEAAYTVDPVAYRDLRADRAGGLPWFDYDGDGGDSVRFGDGSFGERPAPGTAFELTYRVTAGQAGNVAADSIADVPDALGGVILFATNPFPAADGADEEPLEQVRTDAPQAFRARQFRALRVEDYDRTAEELDWVLDAGTSMRWTGSWLSVFTTAQPRTAELPTGQQHARLIELLGRRRIAGYEVFTPEPRYVGLDLVVTVCAHGEALRGEVAAAVLDELGTGRLCDGRLGFFAPGQLRFGDRLERSELEAAIQRAAGVEGVIGIDYRRRGYLPDFVAMPEAVTVGREEIIRVDNDPSLPDHGSIRLVVQGGK
ncbi:MAG: baseplate J/gp47 family protein [Actinobacteria bacterium]|nr:baseplate J/gp47 family protein [Actinomycetota bacterium]